MNVGRTSESVAAGHPDRLCDIISDSFVDLALSKNKYARVSVETMVCTDEVILRGELGGVTFTDAEIELLVRERVKAIGYIDVPGFSYDTLKINHRIVEQSGDIAQGVVGDKKVKGCFPPGTMIRTAAGTKPIELIAVGEMVYTHEGRLRPVEAIFDNGIKPMFHVLAEGGHSVIATDNHPFLTDNGTFVELRHLTPDTLVMVDSCFGAEGWNPIFAKPYSIQPGATQPSIDLRVAGDHSFVANGFVVHNSGDQGIMFGYATKETPGLLPAQFFIAKELMHTHNIFYNRRQYGIRPDAKSQITLASSGDNVILLSVSHDEGADVRAYVDMVIERTIDRHPWIQKHLEFAKLLINPTGRFVVCGPAGDTGLTGRKIVADAYGGACPVGGGAFSSKDPSKVDRSAAYMARYLATQLTHFNLEEVLVGLSYAIGVAEPTSIQIISKDLTDGKAEVLASQLAKNYDLTPEGIIQFLQLRDIKYAPTAENGHFGRYEEGSFTWERGY